MGQPLRVAVVEAIVRKPAPLVGLVTEPEGVAQRGDGGLRRLRPSRQVLSVHKERRVHKACRAFKVLQVLTAPTGWTAQPVRPVRKVQQVLQAHKDPRVHKVRKAFKALQVSMALTV